MMSMDKRQSWGAVWFKVRGQERSYQEAVYVKPQKVESWAPWIPVEHVRQWGQYMPSEVMPACFLQSKETSVAGVEWECRRAVGNEVGEVSRDQIV